MSNLQNFLKFRTLNNEGIIEYPVLTNAAGEGSKTIEQIKRIISYNPCRAAVVGSITLEKREGNPEPNFYYFENLKSAINSVGLKNPGLNYYKKNLPKLLSEFPKSLLILSIAYAPLQNDYKGEEKKELNKNPSLQFKILCEELIKINSKRILTEINLSCPNVKEELLYEDLNLTREILEVVEKESGEKKYTIKIGYMLPKHLNQFVSLISSYNPLGIVAINSMLGRFTDEGGRSYISEEYGGVSGKIIQPYARFMIYNLRRQLDEEGRRDIKIIACGGIFDVKDILNYKRDGADYFQIGTRFMVNESNKDLFSSLLIKLFEVSE